MQKLSSGKEITVTRATTHTAKSGNVTLVVDYLTDLPLRDYLALAPQTGEVWALYRGMAEGASARTVMINATDSRGAQTPFAFTREESGQWQGPAVRTLRGGRKLLVIRSTTDAGGTIVDYVTQLSTRDLCPLSKEVEELWPQMLPEVESAGAKKAFICPNEAPVGGALVCFAFTRSDDGKWATPDRCQGGV